MRYVLPTVRLPLMASSVAFLFLVWGLGLPFVAGSARAWSRWRAFILRRICRSLLWLMGARVESYGTPPRAPFVLVSNHLSYVDILLLASRLDTVFVSKYEVSDWPLLGVLCRAMGTVFLNRESRRDLSRVLDEMNRHLDHGCGIVFFPEGTSTNGSGVLDFRPSLLEIAVRLRQPVSYASLRYATSEGQPAAADAVCWWGDAPFVPHFLRLLSMPGFRAELRFGAQPIASSNRKRLALELRQAVLDQLMPASSRAST